MKIKNNKKIDAAPKNDAGGDEKHIYFFTLPNIEAVSMTSEYLQDSD